jgi:putative aldouronate transport system substrate-binding protein
MENTKKSIVTKLMIFILCFAVVSACSKKVEKATETGSATPAATAAPAAETAAPESPAPTTEALKEVKLTFYYPSNPPGPDQQLINDEINKYLKEKINATVDLKPLTFDEYDARLNTNMAAGEGFDIAWASRYWLLPYQSNVDKGAFMELTDEMLAKYAPEARKNIPDKFWPDMKATDGKVYGFPVYQVAAKTKSFVIQKRFIDKYSLDVSTIKTYKDLEPFLKTLKEKEKGIIPLGLAQNSNGFFTDPNVVGTDGSAVLYKKDDTTFKALTDLEMLTIKTDYYSTIHNWYQAGYINEDAAIVKNINDLRKKGNVAVGIEFTSKPGGEVDEKNINGGNEVVYVPISESYFTGISSAMQIISKTSKNPERALMFINLLNTDKYLYNLICYGIKDKHYTQTDDKYIAQIKDSGYAPNVDWVFGNQFNAFLKGEQSPDVWNKTVQLNDNALVVKSYGFSVNGDTIKSEVANTQAAKDEFLTALETGSVDPKDILPKFVAKLKSAGQEKIDKEIATQWTAFLAK